MTGSEFGDQSGFPRAHEVVDTAFGPVRRTMWNQFVPESWMRVAAVAMMARQESALLRAMGPSRRGHRLAPTPEQLAEFEAWRERYESAVAVGYDRGWLGGGYEPDEVVDSPPGEWVWDESEEDFNARHAAWWAQVAPDGYTTIPKAKS